MRMQTQMGLFAKSIDNINSWKEEIDAALDGDKISITARVEYQDYDSPSKVT